MKTRLVCVENNLQILTFSFLSSFTINDIEYYVPIEDMG